MRSLLLFFLINLIGTGYPETLKDPWVRDEDISRTVVDVDLYSDGKGVYVYEYTVASDETNLGVIQFLSIELSCGKTFDGVELPEAEKDEGYINIESMPGYDQLKMGKRTPATISAKFGNAAMYSFTLDNYAD